MSQNIKIKDLPKRPIRSKNLAHIGNKVTLTSNHFSIDLPKDLEQVYIYNFSIFDEDNIPLEDNSRYLVVNLIKSVSAKLKELFQRYYSSGMNLWTTNDISTDDCTIKTTYKNREYFIRLKKVRSSSLKELIKNNEYKMELQQILNIVVKNYLLRKGYQDVDVNQKYYKSSELMKQDATVQQSNNVSLQILEGYFTSVQIIGGKPYLLIDFISRVLRNETVYDLIKMLKSKDQILQALKGRQVMAKYGNHRMYKVIDFDFTKTPSSPTEHDPAITYMQYYLNAYSVVIKDKNQPLIIAKLKKARSVFLIPELMRTTGLTDSERLNGKLMVDISATTKKDPSTRNSIIMNCGRDLRTDFQNDGYNIQPVRNLEAIQLNPPQIKTTNKWENVDQRRNVIVNKVLKPCILLKNQWYVIYRTTCQEDDDDIDQIIDLFKEAAVKLGTKLEEPHIISLKSINAASWIAELKIDIKINRPLMVVSAVSDKCGSLYAQIKQFLLMEGIGHQNIQPLKFLKTKSRPATAQKIIMQINAKLGFPLWQVEIPAGISQKTMLIGLDVYHQTMAGRRSVAGFVATMDAAFTQYWSASIILGKGQELTHNIAGYVSQALNVFKLKNKFLPDTIIFYRDGVGESQINDIMEAETLQIVNMFQTVSQNYNPAFVEIIINKRIRHRFFLADPNNSSKQVNPSSGTLIGNTVVEEGYQFKMIGQNVTSGTATPTHYQLIYNSSNIKEETFWQLTYWQCFNYANWQGPVRVPAVCQYAHKLAYMIGELVQEVVEGDIQEKLYFL